MTKRIADCSTNDPCRSVLCPLCARRYRLWAAAQTAPLASSNVEAHVLTILLTSTPGSELWKIDLDAEHQRLRKRLVRAGFKAAIGGTEADYDAADDLWTVHVHLLALGDIKGPLARLRTTAKDDGLNRPVVSQKLKDPIEQITYLQKFLMIHRPGEKRFHGKGRAYPLKPTQVLQFARWVKKRDFKDFQFLLGFRRRGSKIVAETGI